MQDVLDAATAFFGPGGLELQLVSATKARRLFEGTGGYVQITVWPSGGGTAVEAEAREWDGQAREFLASL